MQDEWLITELKCSVFKVQISIWACKFSKGIHLQCEGMSNGKKNVFWKYYVTAQQDNEIVELQRMGQYDELSD